MQEDQFKKRSRDENEQGRMKSCRTKRKASKVARFYLKEAASRSMAQGSKVPFMDEILAEALGKVAVKSLVIGKALVHHVAKNCQEFGIKKVWIGKLKAALDMEVARGNLLLVTTFKSI